MESYSMVNTDLNIQPLTEADYEKWLLLWHNYLDFYNTSLPKQVSENTWSKINEPNVPIYGFGAFHEGELIGFTHVVLHPNTWNITECCYLEDLYVNQALRGYGVGRALIEYVYDFAEHKNCNRVYWVTNEDNKTARKLYDKLAQKTDMLQYRKDFSK